MAKHSLRTRLIHGTLWAYVARAIGLTGTVLTSAILARVLSRADMGLFFLAGSAMRVASTVGQLGLGRVGVRRVAQALAVQGPGEAARLGRGAISLGMIGTAIVGLILYSVGISQIGVLVPSAAGLESLRTPLAIWLLGAATTALVAQVFRGFHDLRMGSLFGGAVGPILGATAYASLLMMDLQPTIVLVAWITAGVAVITAALALVFLRKRLAPAFHGLVSASSVGPQGHARMYEMVVDARPFWISSVALLVFAQADIWLVAAFREQHDVALYGASLRLIGLAAVSTTIVSTTIQASISELQARGEYALMGRTLRISGLLGGLPAAGLLLLFLIFPDTWLRIVFGAPYQTAGSILAWLSVGNLLALLFGMPGIALRMMDQERLVMKVVLMTGGCTVAAAFVAVQSYGAVGVAIVTTTGVLVQRVVMWQLARQRLGLRTDVLAIRFAEAREAVTSVLKHVLAPIRARM